tara:strand:+ start:215 stop:706 length:492 start_codon:yes stop_codon:yes gene_type:complete
MGNKISEIVSECYVNFEDVQQSIHNRNKRYVVMNTMPSNLQSCLISGTIPASDEESTINQLISSNQKTWFSSTNNNIDNVTVIIYGKNNNEQNVFHKYNQLRSLGFSNVFIYPGGMFEWLLLQDIYGDTEFPTTSRELDILMYKPTCSINHHVNAKHNLLMAP